MTKLVQPAISNPCVSVSNYVFCICLSAKKVLRRVIFELLLEDLSMLSSKYALALSLKKRSYCLCEHFSCYQHPKELA